MTPMTIPQEKKIGFDPLKTICAPYDWAEVFKQSGKTADVTSDGFTIPLKELLEHKFKNWFILPCSCFQVIKTLTKKKLSLWVSVRER